MKSFTLDISFTITGGVYLDSANKYIEKEEFRKSG